MVILRLFMGGLDRSFEVLDLGFKKSSGRSFGNARFVKIVFYITLLLCVLELQRKLVFFCGGSLSISNFRHSRGGGNLSRTIVG